jgi:N-acetyl-gamma-glutamyl-phosphate reductase
MHVTVLGSNGYTGMLLLRILARHPEVTRITAASRSQAGMLLAEADPGLAADLVRSNIMPKRVVSPDDALADPGDVLFSALPHNASAMLLGPVLGKKIVIDLSADFRFSDPLVYAAAYGVDPPQQEYQGQSVYGLSEWYRRDLVNALVIANPGCYPTASLLPLLPILPFIPSNTDSAIVINAMSGLSGAGKKETVSLLFAERTENGNAYNPGRKHRHAAEISEQLQRDDVIFNPHLVPLKQGMAATTTVTVNDPSAAIQALREQYAEEPFVTLTGTTPPEIRHVRSTNRISLGWHQEGNRLILMSVIDNLWKGASGQAVQNMNIRCGFPETTGLLRDGDV